MAAASAAGGDLDFSFLDFSDCNDETKSFLLDLLDSNPKPKQQPLKSQVQPQQPPQHFQQVYATPTATSQPLVYINNVTANVNVHHGGQVAPPEPAPPAGQPATGPRPMVSHSGFPPPPPNPMPGYPTGPPANAGPPPAGLILPPQNPQFIYQHQFAAALAKTAGPQPYMHAPQVIYYPYPIPVSAGQPQVQPQQRLRSSPTMMPPPPQMMPAAPTQSTTAAEQPYLVQPQVPQIPQPPVPIPAAFEQPQVTKPQEPQFVVAKEEPVQEQTKPAEPAPQPKPAVPAEIAEEQKPSEVAEQASKPSEFEEPKTKSWASLFQKDIPVNVISSNKPMARIQPYTMPEGQKADMAKKKALSESNDDLEMAKFLTEYNLTHRSNMIKPRGLSNRSNWCFVNAILQALVACPPFYNLMKAMPLEILKKASMTKITKVVQEFFAEFAPLDHFPRISKHNKSKKNEDLPVGMTFEASSIFQFLLGLTSDTFKVEEGRQEDAEEFLTFFLNALNDEMLALLKLLLEDEEDELEGHEQGLDQGQDDQAEWHEVGAKNRSLLTRRVGNSNETIRTPMGQIFQGQIQSCVTSSNGEPTATLQPFFTLPLDIQSKSIKNVSDALIHNFTAETLDGYVCSKTKKEIEASRSLYLDELPSVLILHLKRFIYDETSSGGCQKLLKNIDFPVDLEIPKDILSNSSKNKYHPKQRSYKLFAVVYHNGKEASLGHYVTDVYHAGLGWLHCDDNSIKSMTESMVLAHCANSVPYILFYRRGDTMGSGTNNNSNNSINK